MEAVVRESIKQVQAHSKAHLPWNADEPWQQKVFGYKRESLEWSTYETSNEAITTKEHTFASFAVLSWNIDFMLPFPESRMRQAVKHLESMVSRLPVEIASVVYLQESTHSDLKTLSESEWVRENYHLTDTDTSNWSSGYYGTVTLVDKRLPVTSCFRVHYSQTRMERDAFFVDVAVGQKRDNIVRFCNTHLESLAIEPPRRPAQVALAAKYMRENVVYGALMAGDFNAIQDFDRSLHSDNSLKDAYLELGGKEDSDEGFTWGQQAATKQREMFDCSRMDKVFYCGGLKLKSFERFGGGIEVEDEREREHIVQLGFDRPWITDHLGVMAVFEVGHSSGT